MQVFSTPVAVMGMYSWSLYVQLTLRVFEIVSMTIIAEVGHKKRMGVNIQGRYCTVYCFWTNVINSGSVSGVPVNRHAQYNKHFINYLIGTQQRAHTLKLKWMTWICPFFPDPRPNLISSFFDMYNKYPASL